MPPSKIHTIWGIPTKQLAHVAYSPEQLSSMWFVAMTVLTKMTVKPAVGWHTLFLPKAQVPLAHNMCAITSFTQSVSHSRVVEGQTVGLFCPDNTMLQSCVDLNKENCILNVSLLTF